MKLLWLYKSIIDCARQEDPRKEKKSIKSYPDTQILFGNPQVKIKKLLVGIDIETPELILADRLRSLNGLDLVIAHHPEGSAYARLQQVMELQFDILKQAGVKPSVARRLLDERIQEVERRILPQNHTRGVDAARLLNLPFICVHTPADNHAFSYIKRRMDKEKPKRVKDIIDILLKEPEYRLAEKNSTGPRIILGNPNRPAGKILVEMTGGTEGPKDIFDQLYKAGIRTLVSMHLGEEHFKKVKEANLNVVIAGHISSDVLGLNLLLDKIEKLAKERLQVIGCSGFNRFSRR